MNSNKLYNCSYLVQYKRHAASMLPISSIYPAIRSRYEVVDSNADTETMQHEQQAVCGCSPELLILDMEAKGNEELQASDHLQQRASHRNCMSLIHRNKGVVTGAITRASRLELWFVLAVTKDIDFWQLNNRHCSGASNKWSTVMCSPCCIAHSADYTTLFNRTLSTLALETGTGSLATQEYPPLTPARLITLAEEECLCEYMSVSILWHFSLQLNIRARAWHLYPSLASPWLFADWFTSCFYLLIRRDSYAH